MTRSILGLVVAAAVLGGGWLTFGTGTAAAACPHAAQVPDTVEGDVEDAVWSGISSNRASIPLLPKVSQLLASNVPSCD
jgi:hypothetical protein